MPGKALVPRPAQPVAVRRAPWEPDPGREKTEPAYRWLWKRRHWSVPVAALPLMWLAGVAVHEAHAGGYTQLAGALIIIFTATLARYKWNRRGEQVYAVASVTLAFMWLCFATQASLFGLWLNAPLVAGVTIWGVFWWRHKRPRGYRRRHKLIGKWDEWWQSHCWDWQLGGSKVIDVQAAPVTTRVRVQGVAGRHSLKHVEAAMHLIETSAEGFADVGMIRVAGVKGKPSQFDLFLKRENPLRQIVDFDMSLAPKSVHEPIPDGLTESSTWKMISATKNRFVLGETRSGKSNDLLVGLACLTGCPDGYQILIDLKGGRSARPVLEAGAVACVVTELDEARLTLRMLEAESLARAKYAYNGEEQLHATVDIPALHLLIDEVNGLTSTANGDTECSAKLGRVASLGNGLAIYTWVYTQHGSLEESVRTEQTRANLPVRSVYRVAEARHGAYAIPEFHKLDASKLEENGTHYVKDGKDATAEQVRAPYMPHKLLKKIAAQNAALLGTRPPLRLYCGKQIAYGEVTWQQWWDSRWARLDDAFHSISPQYQQYQAVVTSPSPAAAYAAAAPAREMAAAAHGVLPSEPGEGSAESAAERIRREMAETYSGVTEGAIRPRKDLGDAMRQRREAFIFALTNAPAAGTTPKTLSKESGMASTWVYQTLGRLQEASVVTKLGRGRYAVTGGANVQAGLDAIDAEAAVLYQEATQAVNSA